MSTALPMEIGHRVPVVTRTTQFADLPDYVEVPDIAAYLNRSKWWVYERVKDGTFTNCGPGKNIQVPKSELHSSRMGRVKP